MEVSIGQSRNQCTNDFSIAILDCRRVWEWATTYATKIRVQPSNWGGSGEHFRCNLSQPPQPPQLDLFSRRSKSQIYSDPIKSNPDQLFQSNQFKSVQFHPFQISSIPSIPNHSISLTHQSLLSDSDPTGPQRELFSTHRIIAEDHPRPIQHMGSRGRGNVTLPDG